MEWLARLFLRHRAWLGVLAAALSALALVGATRVQVDDVPASIFRSDDAEYARLERVFADFGADDTECLVLLEGEELLDAPGAALVRTLDRKLSAIEGVEEVWSLADVLVFEGGLLPRPLLPAAEAPPEAWAAARAGAHAHPLVADQLYSIDGTAAVMVAHLGGAELEIGTLRERVGAVREVVAAEVAQSGIRGRVSGVPAIRVVIFDGIRWEQKFLSVMGALVGCLIGIAVFQRPAPVVITSAASVVAALWALGFMGLSGEPLDLLTTQLPLLVMVIAFTDAVHLMMMNLRRRSEGMGARDAAAHSIRQLGLPCALTSLTTAVGFGSLATSHIEAIQRFGVLFSVAIGVSFVAVLSVVPLLSSALLRSSRRAPMATRFGGLHAPAERVIRWTVARARPVAGFGIAATVLLLVVALGLTPENRQTEATPRGNEAVEALHALEEHFGGVLNASVLVRWPQGMEWRDEEPLAVLDAVRTILEEEPFTRAPLSVLDLLDLFPGEGGAAQRAPWLELLPAELVGRFLHPGIALMLVGGDTPTARAPWWWPACATRGARSATPPTPASRGVWPLCAPPTPRSRRT